MGKFDLLSGYALAFGVVAVLQVLVAAAVCLWWLGPRSRGRCGRCC